jgi:hypothetical protein
MHNRQAGYLLGLQPDLRTANRGGNCEPVSAER